MKVYILTIIVLSQFIYINKCINIRQGLFNPFHDKNKKIDMMDHSRITELYETSSSMFKYKTQQNYKGIPIFGASLVFEKEDIDSIKATPIFGKWYDKNTMDLNIQSIIPTINKKEALNIAINALNIKLTDLYGNVDTKLYIYYDDQSNIPYLSYIIKLSYNQYQSMIIINANNGDIFKIYDNKKKFISNVCGNGGNRKIGKISYCGSTAFKINDDKNPILANHYVQIYNNSYRDYTDKSQSHLIKCLLNNTSGHYMVDDKEQNGGYCTGCDVFQFTTFIFDLFIQHMNTMPVSDKHIPLKAYIHVGINWDSSYYDDINGAINFGDGNGLRYPLGVIDIVGHEIGHGFTAKGSDLINSGESGAIDNAYADLVGEVAEYFYSGSNDWRIGADSYRGDAAERYLDDPTIDGISIDHYNDYYVGINPYYSSGIYSKAIYLLNTRYHWSMEDIFKIFSTANQLYWTNDITFSDGLCGLYEVLNDFYGTNTTKILSITQDLSKAFNTVGVSCQRNQTVINCGDNGNTYCIYKEVIPSTTEETISPIQIALESNDFARIGINATIYITIRETHCISPSISFEYEEIDLDDDFEYIDVFNYEYKLIERCGSKWQCGSWNTSCIDNYKLGLVTIEPDNTYIITVSVSSAVGPLCGIQPANVINSRLIFKCSLNTPSPTSPQPSTSPITLSPTLPTLEPTIPTLHPTPYPTHIITDCSRNETERRYCYYQEIYASIDSATETIVKIQNFDESMDVYYQIILNVVNYDCIQPTILFTFEAIDYDLDSEHLAIYDNDGDLLSICNAPQSCNTFATCLYHYPLRSKILKGETYNITVLESSTVDALCSSQSGHKYSINARLQLNCNGGTSNPTSIPTMQPTLNPTIPTLQSPSIAPTMPTKTPTATPTAGYWCGDIFNTLCYNVDVTPDSSTTTSWSISVQDGVHHIESYYNVIFKIHNEKCIEPSLSFSYEQIDYDHINEYLDVFNNDKSLITRCGNNTGRVACNVFDSCLTDYNLGINAIRDNTSYQISITKPEDVHSQCVDHSHTINAKVTLHCKAGTANPTTDPTLYPSTAPTEPTLDPTPSPTYHRQICGINRYCIFLHISPHRDIETVWDVVIQNTNDSKETYFDLYVTPYDADCVSPTVSFEFERIDYNAFNEYILVSGTSGFAQKCGGDNIANNCGQFDICLNNSDLRINRIPMYESYKFEITESESVESECKSYHDFSINAKLTLKCAGYSAAPTLEPTPEPTSNPTEPTEHPSYSPSLEPTEQTSTPTLSPTHDIKPCGVDTNDHRYCLYEDIYPLENNLSSFDITIQNIDETAHIYYEIYFTSKQYQCIHPSISFIYEAIDYDQDYEYINITAANGVLLAQCNGGAFSCGTYRACLDKYSLGVQKIGINRTYSITLGISEEADALCLPQHKYVINAILTLYCNNTDIITPTQSPTPEPTPIPTMITAEPSSNPSISPSLPSISPTQSPTYVMVRCGLNTFCINVDMYPSMDIPTSYNIPIAHLDINAVIQFNIIFSVANKVQCSQPRLAFNFELIDYDQPDEYINITGNNNEELAICGSSVGAECGVFIDCFKSLEIGTSRIGITDSYKIGVTVTDAVDALCTFASNHPYCINSVLTLTCSAGTTPPTSDPTTAAPTFPTDIPTSMPTQTPTQPSKAPSKAPTWGVLCDVNTWCYHVEIFPQDFDTEWIVPILHGETDKFTTKGVTFKIDYHVHGVAGNACVAPKLSLIYETIDYDQSYEYMNVTDMNGNVISECGMNDPIADCDIFETCFKEYPLNGISQIKKDDGYEITIFQPSDVDNLCLDSNNPYSMNVTLTLLCLSGTAKPSPSPTKAPSVQPTVPTTAPITAQPTNPTLSPTPSPTYVTRDCAANFLEKRYCIDVDMYPLINSTTSYTVELQLEDQNDDIYFDIFFTANGGHCVDPLITFKYEAIDHDQIYEYINITNNENELIAQCGGGREGIIFNNNNVCNQYQICLNETEVGKVKINKDERYKISVINSAEVDALCFEHDWAINAKLTIICSDGTSKPTIVPTPEPTDQPTIPTISPTLGPTNNPTLPTISPTLSPTFMRYKCNDFPITWCYYIDMYPNDDIQSEYQLKIQDEESILETNYLINFHSFYTDCINPSITLKYENIDMDGIDEYIEIFDNNNNLLKQCGDSWICNTFSYCLKNYELSIYSNETIKGGTNYTLRIKRQRAVGGLCSFQSDHEYSINAELSITCHNNINNKENIITNPNGTLCGHNRYCYENKIYPHDLIETKWEQHIYHYNNETATDFDIIFKSINNKCFNPQIQFEYERIDFDGINEFIDIFDNNSALINRCGAGKYDQNECGEFDSCLPDGYNLGIDSIEMSDTYKITLSESKEVDAICSNHSHSINGKLYILCNIKPGILSTDITIDISGSNNPFNTFYENMIINTDYTQKAHKFNIFYNVSNYDCLNPRFSVQTEIKVRTAYQQNVIIYNQDFEEIGVCTSTNSVFCPRSMKCVPNYYLNKTLLIGDIYQFIVYETFNIDDDKWCDDKLRTIPSILTFECDGLQTLDPTSSPTEYPTNLPSITPTIAPTARSGDNSSSLYLSIISIILNSDDDGTYSIIFMTETDQFIELSMPRLIESPLLNKNNLFTINSIKQIRNTQNCQDSKCLKYWELNFKYLAICSYSQYLDFSGIYVIEFAVGCRRNNECTNYLNKNNINVADITLSTFIQYIDGICDNSLYNNPFNVTFDFFNNNTFKTKINDNKKYSINDIFYIEMTATDSSSSSSYIINDIIINNIFICTSDDNLSINSKQEIIGDGACYEMNKIDLDSLFNIIPNILSSPSSSTKRFTFNNITNPRNKNKLYIQINTKISLESQLETVVAIQTRTYLTSASLESTEIIETTTTTTTRDIIPSTDTDKDDSSENNKKSTIIRIVIIVVIIIFVVICIVCIFIFYYKKHRKDKQDENEWNPSMEMQAKRLNSISADGGYGDYTVPMEHHHHTVGGAYDETPLNIQHGEDNYDDDEEGDDETDDDDNMITKGKKTKKGKRKRKTKKNYSQINTSIVLANH